MEVDEQQVYDAIYSIRHNDRSRPTKENILKYLKKLNENISSEILDVSLKSLLSDGKISLSEKNRKSYFVTKTSDKQTTENYDNSIDKSINNDTPHSMNSSYKETPGSHKKFKTTREIDMYITEKVNETVGPFVKKIEALMHEYIVVSEKNNNLTDENKAITEELCNMRTQNKSDQKVLERVISEVEFLKTELTSKNEIIRIIIQEKNNVMEKDNAGEKKEKNSKKSKPSNSKELNEIKSSSRYNERDQGDFINVNDNLKPRATTILGDSILKGIKPRNLRKKLPPKERVYVKSFSGATISQMRHYAKPSMDFNPQLVILHCGTNDLKKPTTAKEIANEIIQLGQSIKRNENEIMYSSITARNDRYQEKAMDVNNELKLLCHENNYEYIDNSNIRTRYHICDDNLHLNEHGSVTLGKNFVNAIRI